MTSFIYIFCHRKRGRKRKGGRRQTGTRGDRRGTKEGKGRVWELEKGEEKGGKEWQKEIVDTYISLLTSQKTKKKSVIYGSYWQGTKGREAGRARLSGEGRAGRNGDKMHENRTQKRRTRTKRVNKERN